MSNIAGKTYAMNVITPVTSRWRYLNKFIFWGMSNFLKGRLNGLITLSMIHYARWVIIKPSQFPRLSKEQPKEELKYSYMIFESNFNGSWEQYVDSFHSAIPSGLDSLWFKNVNYPKSSPLTPFHKYIMHNQIFTEYYYSAYPMAASNDVKAAQKVKQSLGKLTKKAKDMSAEEFQKAYHKLVLELQHCLNEMHPSPIISISAQAVQERAEQRAQNTQQKGKK